MSNQFEIVVIGGGSVGSAAAYHLARDGRQLLLLEQFKIGHVRGSSHGESRIIRHSYGELDYASLAPTAFAMWRELEAAGETHLLQMTGGVDIGPRDAASIRDRVAALSAGGFPFEVLNSEAAASALPQFRFAADEVALIQPGAGILHASRCVRALADRALAHGALLREECVVQSVQPDGDGVRVEFISSDGPTTIYADRAIITAGPWAGRFFSQLGLPVPFEVVHQQVIYFAVEDEAAYAVGNCPLYIVMGEPGFYGFPIWERPGQIKIGAEFYLPVPDPDMPPLPVDDKLVAGAAEAITRRMKGVDPVPCDVVTCRYTVVPDRDFILDRHPEYPQIVLGSPCSGHGFKFSITSGRLLADLATSPSGDYRSPLWRERFNVQRLSQLSAR